MDFVFVCKNTRKDFKSEDFEITENKGVKTDASGNKILDAKVVLTKPCPFCGEKHSYQASELACPFNG